MHKYSLACEILEGESSTEKPKKAPFDIYQPLN